MPALEHCQAGAPQQTNDYLTTRLGVAMILPARSRWAAKDEYVEAARPAFAGSAQ